MSSSDSLAKTAYILLILLISLVLLYWGRQFLIPLVLAIMTWSLTGALAEFFRQIPIGTKKMPRWLAMSFATFTLISLIVLIYQILSSQADAMVTAAPVYQKNFNQLVGELMAVFGIKDFPISDTLLKNVDVGALLGWVGGSIGSIFSSIFLMFVYTAFLFAEQDVISGKITALHNRSDKAAETHKIMTDIASQVKNYIWMKTLISLLTGLLSFVTLKWVGVDFAVVWALLIFLLNFIPNIGSILGVALCALASLMQFDSLTPFLIIIVSLGTVQFIIGSLIEPALMGKSLNLSSFMIILSLTFWGLLWGIPGMFLSVPIMVIFTIVCSHFKHLRGIAVILSGDGNLRS